MYCIGSLIPCFRWAGSWEEGEKAAAEVPTMTMTETMIMTATTAEAPETEEASAVAVPAGISDAIDKVSQLCYNDENQFREGVIRV